VTWCSTSKPSGIGGTGGNNGEPGGGDDVFTVEYTTIGQAAPETKGVDEEPAEQSPLPTKDDDTEVDDNIDDNLVDHDNLGVDHDDDVLLRFRCINNILGMARFAPRALMTEELHVVSFNEPISFGKTECSTKQDRFT
jgi:hypothetical protein